MKYIISKHGSPIIFSEAENHSDIAKGVGGALSAGFVSFRAESSDEIKARCWGKSVSLRGLESRGEEDAQIIQNMFNPY